VAEAPGDLDLDLDMAEAEAPAESVAEEAADEALPDLDLEETLAGDDLGDLGDFASDMVATKLELAQTYFDMDDFAGARSILDEVLAEGSEAQQQQARELLERLPEG
jgi:pilus assembly protein FimV